MWELVKALNRANDSYFNSDKGLLSESEYDEAFNELVKKEIELNYIYPNSPTKVEGFKVLSEFKKLNDIYLPKKIKSVSGEVKNLKEFLGDREYISTPILDGVEAIIEYKNGNLYRAYTLDGIDITEHIKVMLNIPLRLYEEVDLTVTGTIVMKYGDMEHYNSVQKEENKLEHNLAAVKIALSSLDTKLVKDFSLRFYANDCLEIECDTYVEKLKNIASLGLGVVFTQKASDNLAQNMYYLNQFSFKYNYPIIGVRFIFNNLNDSNNMYGEDYLNNKVEYGYVIEN